MQFSDILSGPVKGGNSHGNEFILQNSYCFANTFKLRPAKN